MAPSHGSTYGSIDDALCDGEQAPHEKGPQSGHPTAGWLGRPQSVTAATILSLVFAFVAIFSLCAVGFLGDWAISPIECFPLTAVQEWMPPIAPQLRDAGRRPVAPIPFEHVDRAAYGSVAAESIVDPTLFDPSIRGDPSSGRLLKVPFPTGAFWTNLVLSQMTSDMGFSFPVMAYPYGYKWSPQVVQVSYPPLRRLLDEISIRDIFNPDLTFSTVETSSDRHVMGWDPLSVTLRYNVNADEEDKASTAEKYWETYLVQGSPYVTLAYLGVTPVFTPISIFDGFTCPISSGGDGGDVRCSIVDAGQPGRTVPPDIIKLKGTRFLIHTRENLTWMVFASQTITLSFDNIRKTTITSVGAFSGVLRLALVPPPQDQLTTLTSQFPDKYKGLDDLSSSSGVSHLACHANTYPVGGRVTWDFPTGKNVAKVHFRYNTRLMTQEGARSKDNRGCDPTELLMLALPHHTQVLASDRMLKSVNEFDLIYRSIKGMLVPVLGDTWSYDEPLTSIGFDSASSLQNAASLDDSTRNIILDQVEKDMFVVLPTLDENVYGFGKQVARLAQLAHIVSVLDTTTNEEGQGDTQENDERPSLSVEITQLLHKYVTAYLLGLNRDKLLFDINFGGVVSKDGLEFSGGDFGNGWYNDHLFHYGYALYASAVLGKLNATFVAEHGIAVDALLFDVAYSANADSQQESDAGTYFLPFARHKSWYDSHSFASGLFPFADGKSMESSAESVNCYYGSYLWSLVRWGPHGDSFVRHESSIDVDFARLLLATEIRGVKTYWHMITPDEEVDDFHTTDVYNPIFSKSLMVGNVGMMDVTVATWFGTNPLYVHMINFLPITAITRVLFEKRYIKEEFKSIIEPVYHTVEMAWRGYVTCDRAMVDPSAAWNDALELRSYELDQAISQSQVLYFASTTDGFVAPRPTSSDTNQGENRQQTSSVFCSEHSACVELGVEGECCPAPGGAYLDCCEVSEVGVPPHASSNSESLCAKHRGCADLDLTGNCCPSDGGVFLGCCDS